MKTLKRISFFVLLAFVVLLSVLLFNTYTLKSYQIDVAPASEPQLKEGWAQRLSQAIQVPTINHENPIHNDTATFSRLINLLEANYPLVSKNMEVKRFGHSLLYRWKGKNASLPPVLYMAHLDVVPVEQGEQAWEYPPFSGAIEQGYIWGRGAMDVKNLVCAMLEASEHLIEKGFEPQRDIYFAMGQDEETGGMEGNGKIAQYLQESRVRLEYVLDEGLFILSGVFPGVSLPTALVGIAEKGSVDLQITALSEGGHASNPPRDNAVALLSQALVKINQKGFPAGISGATGDMFRFLAPEMSLPFNVLFSNMWLFEPLLLSQLDRPPTMSSIRTTVAPTILEGSQKSNVLPQKAHAVLDLRLLPGETQHSAAEYISKLVAGERVKVDFLHPPLEIDNPSPISCVDCEPFQIIHQSIKEVFGQVLVAPSLFVARSDSKHYVKLANHVYRFNPLQLNKEDISRFHGTNERISLDNYEKIIGFYIKIMEKN